MPLKILFSSSHSWFSLLSKPRSAHTALTLTPVAFSMLATLSLSWAESAQAEKNQRESEARQHPIIRKAQEIFGTAPKEIKTQ